MTPQLTTLSTTSKKVLMGQASNLFSWDIQVEGWNAIEKINNPSKKKEWHFYKLKERELKTLL